MRKHPSLAILLALGAVLAIAGCRSKDTTAEKKSASIPGAGTGSGEREAASPSEEGASPESARKDRKGYRGLLTPASSGWLFQACGSGEKIRVSDRTAGAIGEAAAMLGGGAGEPLYVEMVGAPEPVPSAAGSTRSPSGALDVFELRRATLQGEEGCLGKPVLGEFRGYGNEPFWNVEVALDGIVFSEIGQAPIRFPYAVPRKTGGRQVYVTTLRAPASHRLTLDFEERKCTDTMSGEYFSFAVEANLDGRRLRGCAVEGGP